MTVDIRHVTPHQSGAGIKGTLKAKGALGSGAPSDINTEFEGQFHAANGLLAVTSPLAPPRVEPGIHFTPPPIIKYISDKVNPPVRSTTLLGRTSNGRGWTGTIEGENFSCSVVALDRVDGASMAVLSMISADHASSSVSTTPTSPSLKRFWIRYAADYGSIPASNTMGEVYEKGVVEPRDYAKAAAYYRLGVEKGDVFAQTSMARLLYQGSGVPKDAAEADRLTALAANTKQWAARVCTSPRVYPLFERLLAEEATDPMAVGLQFFVAMMTGIEVNEGQLRVVQVTLAQVFSRDRPFSCTALLRRVSPKINNLKPDLEYVGTDQDGNLVYRDQRFEARANEIFAAGMTNLITKLPAVTGFRIQPLGGERFRVSTVPPMRLAREYSADVDMR